MTHSPPIPPGNQSPYPIAEPPHAQPAATPPAEATVADKARELAPTLILGAVAAAAATAIATVVIRSRRKAAAAARPARKAAKSRPAPKPKAAKAAARAPTVRAAAAKTTAKRPSSLASTRRKPRASADDKAIRGPQDASRIAMGEDYEVRYWTEKFGVDRDTLQRAVDEVGNGAEAVGRKLGKS